MLKNRSFPPGDIIPELVYPDLDLAVDWLCRVFGFSERLRIADHRSQLVFGNASVVAIGGGSRGDERLTHSLMVRVEDVDQHYNRSKESGATIIRPPETYMFGERQYTVEDIGGHRWTFSQSVADVNPEDWGGRLGVAYDHEPRNKSRLDHLALPVAECARSRDWYITNLGLELEFEVPQHKTIALKDAADLTLFLYEKAEAKGATSCTLTFQVDDVEAKYQELSAKGVVFEKSPQKLLWGYGAELRDPDGYLIYLWDEKSMREKGN